MQYVVWTMVALLIVLHQDIWLWDNPKLVFGFLPITLAYHMGISIGAGITWYLAIHYCWPFEKEPTKIDDSLEGAGQ